MAVIKPFRALRPVPEKAKQVSCAPYDVAYESEAREFIKENPLSFLRVTRPEALFPEQSNPANEEIFTAAVKNLERFVENDVFTRDDEPCIYIYRLAAKNHSQTGVVACCSLEEYERGIIKKHEKTRPDKVEDRTEHMLALRAQTGLIFLAFRNTNRIRRLIEEAAHGEPIYDFACFNGIRQTVWKISQTKEFVEAFKEVPALYIADGHHRMESANLARKRLIEQNAGRHTGAEDYNFVVAGMFPAEDLKILAYNRVVKSLNNLTEEEFFEKLKENFTVSETEEKEPRKHGEICMFFGGEWYKLRFNGNLRESDPIERLDVSILQNYILRPILGINDPRTDQSIIFVGGARGTEELENIVAEGKAKVAFSLFPTTMEDLFAVSDMDAIMPPKSTWFEPKLKDGLLIHLI